MMENAKENKNCMMKLTNLKCNYFFLIYIYIMPRTRTFDIESPILSKLKTPLDSFNRYILPIILLLIFGMFIYVFYIGMQKKDPEEL